MFFIERARVADGAIERVAERLRWAGLDGRYDVPLDDLGGLTGSREGEDAARAIIGHLARAGIRLPGALAARPCSPDASSAGGTAARSRSAAARSRDAERIRWYQYRAVWAYVEAERLPPRALLRTSAITRARARGGVLRRL